MKRLNVILIGLLLIVLGGGSFLFFAKYKSNMSRIASEESIVKEAQALERKGNLLKTKGLYQKLIRDYPQSKYAAGIQKAMGDLNVKLLFSSIETQDSKIYIVEPQDTLGKIAKKFGTTVELIMRTNSLKSDLIRPGMKLKISTLKFSILVDKSRNALILKASDDIFKIYQVATGIDNSTPIGQFKIIVKIIDPTWYKAGAIVPPGSPKNILGSRWLGLSIQGYGIHGTTEPESIGKQATAGCVRMLNKEVEELYTIAPVGTDVTIID